MTLESEQTLVQQLLASPRLPFYVEHMEEVLAGELAKRKQFYAKITADEKVEFINGEVVHHSPVRLRHNRAGGHLYRLLSTYVMLHDLGYVGYEKLLISLTRNDYEPDICFFGNDKTSQFTPEQIQFPAPDFVVEVLSSSTEAMERGVKFDDYAAHGVAEYWIVDPVSESVEQYRLNDASYQLVVKAKTGELESFAVPGFVIPIRAIFDETIHQSALRQILSAQE